MRVREIAHARSGDKGKDAMVSLIPYDGRHYGWIAEQITPARVKAHCTGLVLGEVIRHDLPALGAFNFVLKDSLGGGVTRTLALDVHGKALSCLLLDMDMEVPE
ncbi:MAG: hypothetical protein HY725_16755 [Candidatus Rokubacteria bacterium]|nr:hypothetical protein [Candidatus Rokubacteria bacterium]